MVQCCGGGNPQAGEGCRSTGDLIEGPQRIWDNCLEREAYIRSLTAHEIFQLDGQVTETLVSGVTADILPSAAFKWYKWVLFRDTSVVYPDDTMVLVGREIGPALDIGWTGHDPQDLEGQR